MAMSKRALTCVVAPTVAVLFSAVTSSFLVSTDSNGSQNVISIDALGSQNLISPTVQLPSIPFQLPPTAQALRMYYASKFYNGVKYCASSVASIPSYWSCQQEAENMEDNPMNNNDNGMGNNDNRMNNNDNGMGNNDNGMGNNDNRMNNNDNRMNNNDKRMKNNDNGMNNDGIGNPNSNDGNHINADPTNQNKLKLKGGEKQGGMREEVGQLGMEFERKLNLGQDVTEMKLAGDVNESESLKKNDNDGNNINVLRLAALARARRAEGKEGGKEEAKQGEGCGEQKQGDRESEKRGGNLKIGGKNQIGGEMICQKGESIKKGEMISKKDYSMLGDSWCALSDSAVERTGIEMDIAAKNNERVKLEGINADINAGVNVIKGKNGISNPDINLKGKIQNGINPLDKGKTEEQVKGKTEQLKGKSEQLKGENNHIRIGARERARLQAEEEVREDAKQQKIKVAKEEEERKRKLEQEREDAAEQKRLEEVKEKEEREKEIAIKAKEKELVL
jgi:hypothetical protein